MQYNLFTSIYVIFFTNIKNEPPIKYFLYKNLLSCFYSFCRDTSYCLKAVTDISFYILQIFKKSLLLYIRSNIPATGDFCVTFQEVYQALYTLAANLAFYLLCNLHAGSFRMLRTFCVSTSLSDTATTFVYVYFIDIKMGA